jgi:putative GTP pyrophosphokinase
MTENELAAAFESRKPALKALGSWIVDVVKADLTRELGDPKKADLFFQIPPKARVKETDSFLEKALIRKRKDDPLKEITDQVGVRFVVLLLENIDRIGAIIKAGSWAWSHDRDHEAERLAKPDYFAYQSDHYVITTTEEGEWDGVKIPIGLSCEVQIRTILQHAYAEMAHASDYKPSIQLREEDRKRVKRSLAKGCALIETTDDVFKEITTRLREYSKSVDALLAKSAEIYNRLTGLSVPYETPLGSLIGDTYRELLKGYSPQNLEEWIAKYPWPEKAISGKRSESVFYRDPVVILLGLLVTQHETEIPRAWPVDNKYLEDFYSFLGISADGIF